MGDAQPDLLCEPFSGAHHPNLLEDLPGASQLGGAEPRGYWWTHSHCRDPWLANMGSHQPWCFFPLPRALEKVCPLDPKLEAVPRGKLLAAEVEPVVRWLRARADLSLSLPDALLRIREVSLNKRALHLKANLQSLHHRDRPDALGFFCCHSFNPPNC